MKTAENSIRENLIKLIANTVSEDKDIIVLPKKLKFKYYEDINNTRVYESGLLMRKGRCWKIVDSFGNEFTLSKANYLIQLQLYYILSFQESYKVELELSKIHVIDYPACL